MTTKKSVTYRSRAKHRRQPDGIARPGIHLEDGRWVVRCPTCGYVSEPFVDRETAMQARGGHHTHCKPEQG